MSASHNLESERGIPNNQDKRDNDVESESPKELQLKNAIENAGMF
jgi:hypothetical protein